MLNKSKPKKTPGKFRRAFSFAFKPFVNVFAWLGLNTILFSSRKIIAEARRYFIPSPKPQKMETFEQAVKRLRLSPQAIQRKEKSFLRLAGIFAALAVLIILYSIYMAWSKSLGSFLLAFTVGLLALTMAFRYHFWWFQVRHRKLGCTLKEWYGSTLGEKTK